MELEKEVKRFVLMQTARASGQLKQKKFTKPYTEADVVYVDDIPDEYYDEYATFVKNLVETRTHELMRWKQNVDEEDMWGPDDLRRWQYYEAQKFIREAQEKHDGGMLVNTTVLLESDFEIIKNFKEELKARLGANEQ